MYRMFQDYEVRALRDLGVPGCTHHHLATQLPWPYCELAGRGRTRMTSTWKRMEAA